MTKVTIDEITYSVTVAEENVNVTVADATETIQVQIASGASDIQINSTGDTNSLISSSAGVVTTFKTLTAGNNITLGDDGDSITISSTDTEDDLSNNTTDDLTEGTNNLYYTQARADYALQNYSGNITNMGNITGDVANFRTITGDLNAANVNSSGTNLTIDPNGFLFADTDNMYVGSLTQATHITGTTIGSVGNPVTITSGNIIPSVTDTYTLGSPTHVWQDLYLGQASLYIDGQRVIGSDASGDIDITTDSGQNLHLSAGADIILLPQAGETDQGFRVELDRIELGNDGDSTTTVNGVLTASDLSLGDLDINGTLINQTGTNQNLEIRTNGTGYVHVNTSDLYVGALSGAVKIDENSISTTDATQLTIEGFTNTADMTTAINTAESNANAYTDTRETAITTAYQTYADQAEADAITTANSYADTAVSNLVDSAPATLDTLNELAAALGDDANFSTTVTNSIATKWTQDNTKISNWDTAYGWGDHSVVGYLTSYTETDPIFTASQAFDITATNKSNWNTAYSWGNHADEGYLTSYTETDPTVPAHVKAITTNNISNWDTAYGWGDHSTEGYLTDYTVTETDVTAHQAALSITESQISDLTHYTDTDARTAVSLNSSNLNELSYDNTTGVFSYTSPTTVTAVGEVVFDVRNASGVAISRGDAVYIAGHSGSKILVAKSDANVASTMPAIGLANSAMNNNSDGTVLISGEMLSIDTSAFSVGDVLYVSETAGELTSTRPTDEATKVQNIGKVARSDNSNGIVIVSGSGRANDVPNLASGHVFIGNGSGSDTRALTTADVSEGANLYYTDARVQSVIDTNSAGFITTYDPTQADITEHQAALSITESQISDLQSYITDYTVTQGDVTAHQSALSITESQISDLTHYTNAQAISAVQGEATLDLTGQVTMDQDLDVSGVIKINDGFTLSQFNPYAAYGGATMNLTMMGVGEEDGWAAMSVRSRGEHDWGLSGFGIPAESPRAIINLQAGNKDGSNDDYLSDDTSFGNLWFSPYSGYRTGLEWLTPSAEIRAIATEDHSSSGMGTKLSISTTENGNSAGATDSQHTNKTITIQGTTLSTSDRLIIDDDVTINDTLTINGSQIETTSDGVEFNDSIVCRPYQSDSSTIIGDATIGGANYDTHGFKVTGDDLNWATVTLEEYVGGSDKPINAFPNATVAAQVFGGTPSSKTNVISGKRLLTLQGLAANTTDGQIPSFANFRVKGETTEDQTTTNRGTKLSFETIGNGENTTTETLKLQGNRIDVNTSGNGVIGSGGSLILATGVIAEQSFEVEGNTFLEGTLNVDGNATLNGNVTLGNANTDVITSTGKLNVSNGFGNTVLDTNTANYLSGVLGIVSAGDQAYISDGNGGSACMAFFDGSNWKKFHSPNDNISSS